MSALVASLHAAFHEPGTPPDLPLGPGRGLGAQNVYIGRVRGEPAEPVSLGELLTEMKLSKRENLVIGVRTPAGEDTINPPKSLVLERGSLLIFLTESPLPDRPCGAARK